MVLHRREGKWNQNFIIRAHIIRAHHERASVRGPVSSGTLSRLKMLRLKSLRGIFFVITMSLMAAPVLFSQASGTPPPNISVPGSQNPFQGSQPEGKATGAVLQIDLRDVIDRGLRNNLGLLLAGDQTMQANGERWKELSNLLPNFSAGVIEDAQTTSLTALGFKGNLFPFPLPRVIGPFNYLDVRANFSQSLFNYKDLEKERAAAESLKASRLSYKDAREFVVLVVGNSYLLSISAAARVETAQAQVKNAQALYDKADDQLKAGLSPAIDKLRAQVELQTRQQRPGQAEAESGARDWLASGAGICAHGQRSVPGVYAIADGDLSAACLHFASGLSGGPGAP